MRYISLIFVPAVLFLAGCSSSTPKKEARIFSAGEKAAVGDLNYAVVDTQFANVLGTDPATQRTPKDRFVMVQIAVSNAGNKDSAIPVMTLVDDAGQTYSELADGTGVARWLGVIRKVGPTQTEQGVVLFDAPAKHFRLRLTDELDDDISIDMPLSFIHEQMRDMTAAPPDSNVIAVPKK